MTAYKYLKMFEKMLADNSPTLLTAMGVVGTVSTAVLTGKATISACNLVAETIEDHNLVNGFEGNDRIVHLEPRYVVKLTWKLYIPAAVCGAFSVAAIVGSNRISNRRAAALASAFSLAEKGWHEYREEAEEVLGKKKSQDVRDAVGQRKVDENPPSREILMVSDDLMVVILDGLSGRYFRSTVMEVDKAVIKANQMIIQDVCVSLNEFYEMIGLPHTMEGNELGWNIDSMLDMNWTTAISEDDRPCMVMMYDVLPFRDYKFCHDD